LIHLQLQTAATLDLDFNTTVFFTIVFKIEMQIVFFRSYGCGSYGCFFLEGFASVSTGKSKLQLIIKSAFLKAFRLKIDFVDHQ
jgi:hypothetical protein